MPHSSTTVMVNLTNYNNNNNNIPRYNDFWNIDIIHTNVVTFQTSPILIKTLCDIIDDKKNLGYTEIVFTDLSTHLRHKLYKVLCYLKLSFQKIKQNNVTNIKINNIDMCFTVPRDNIILNTRSPTKRRLLQEFFSSINQTNFYNLFSTHSQNDNINNYLFITPEKYITYCTIMNNYYGDYDTPYYATHNTDSNLAADNNNSNNIIKMELSNLIFDIKDNITDIMFKDIMEKLAELKF